jgi:broad specificity phosphatase PhoE
MSEATPPNDGENPVPSLPDPAKIEALLDEWYAQAHLPQETWDEFWARVAALIEAQGGHWS